MVKCGEGCNRGGLARCWHPFHTRTKEAMTTEIECSSYKSVVVFYELHCIAGLYIVGQEISTDSLALGCSTWNYGYTWKVESSNLVCNRIFFMESIKDTPFWRQTYSLGKRFGMAPPTAVVKLVHRVKPIDGKATHTRYSVNAMQMISSCQLLCSIN
jgi:hypothetical protein